MSMNVDFLHDPTFARQTPVVRSRHITKISAQNLAKADRKPGELAYLAAHWAKGGLTIDPITTVLAARVFGVSGPSVHRALDDLGDTTYEPLINHIWRGMSEKACEAFVRENLAVLWAYVDRVTAS